MLPILIAALFIGTITYSASCYADNDIQLQSCLSDMNVNEIIVSSNISDVSTINILNRENYSFKCNNNTLRFKLYNMFFAANVSNLTIVDCRFGNNFNFRHPTLYIHNSSYVYLINTYSVNGGANLLGNPIHNVSNLYILDVKSSFHPFDVYYMIYHSKNIILSNWEINDSNKPNNAYIYLFNSQNILIENITINFSIPLGMNADGFRISSVSNITIRNFSTYNNRAPNSISITNSNNIIVENSSFIKSRPLFISNSNNTSIVNSVFDQIKLRNAIILRGVNRVNVSNNTFKDFIRYAVFTHRINNANDILNQNYYINYLYMPYYVCPPEISFNLCD
ncbi:MAG: right-handed parallel beta-helix repeat-containing protein [Candidatus Anstonellales archaeon]